MKTRNQGLDALKLLCALFVVCQHTYLPGTVGDSLVNFFRIAVPVFFLISGYCYTSVVEKKKQVKQILRILLLFVLSMIFYFAYGTLLHWIWGNASFYLNAAIPSTKKMYLEIFVFNRNLVASPLWYLHAYLYVLVIVFLCSLLFPRKFLYPLIPVLLVGGYVIGCFSPLLFETPIPNYYTRNFLFEGLPFFLLGDYLRTSGKECKIVPSAICSALSIVLCFVEWYLLKSKNVPVYDFTPCLTLLAVSLVLLFRNLSFDQPIANEIAVIGKDTSTFIYLSHWAILLIQKLFLPVMPIWFAWIFPFLTFLLCIGLNYLLRLIPHKK